MLASSHAIQMSNTADVPFAYASARVRMLQQRLLTRGDTERLLAAADVRAGVRVLADTEYANVMAAMKQEDDYEAVLAAELRRVYALVGEFAPQQELLAMWAARHEFLALKIMLKALWQNQEVNENILPVLLAVSPDWLQQVVTQAAAEEPRAPADAAETSLKSSLWQAAQAAVAAYRQYGAPEEMDHVIDGFYQQYLLELTEKPESAFLRGWLLRFADTTNLSTYIRFAVAGRSQDSLQRALLPGGSLDAELLLSTYAGAAVPAERYEALLPVLSGTNYAALVTAGWQIYQKEGLLYGLVRLLEQHLEDYIESARFQPFGLGVVWSYLMAKEREVRLIRLILVGKSAGLSEEQLRGRIGRV